MEPSTKPWALVVDDDALILIHACNILEDAGFRYFDACTSDEAIEILEKRADDVVLLFSDVEMPGRMDGFELARYVDEHWPWIEIVIVSGNIVPQGGDMPEKATFIGKPFSGDMVHAHLQKKLPKGKQPEPLKHAV